ncbi:hypothetical protein ACQ4PT_055141 [Festuca glaucescens]
MAASLLVCATLLQTCLATRRLTALVQEQPITMEYHKGALLTGRIALNLVWYGDFSAPQRAALTDFLSSLSAASPPQPEPSVATWFKTARKYYATSNARFPTLSMGAHVLDHSYSLGKHLKEHDLVALAARGGARRAINVVLTAADVAVAGFCSSRCGSHGASPALPRRPLRRTSWVGKPGGAVPRPVRVAVPPAAVRAPGAPPRPAPTATWGSTAWWCPLASMLVGAVTNPFGNGFFQGPAEAPARGRHRLRRRVRQGAPTPATRARCSSTRPTGASYNANGARGRKYLVPALVDPDTSACSTLG